MAEDIRRIGFIGLGIMGTPMARNLLRAGFDLTVYNRTRARAEALAAEGVKVAASPKAAAAEADAVICMVTDTPDVEAVLLGVDGVVQSAHPGTVVIDMSTISPKATRKMAESFRARGIGMLDAPVSGGDIGAQRGTLTIMVGGEAADFTRARPVFEAMGQTITHMGCSGSGQSTKLCNQVLVAIHLMAVSESLLLARQAGLNLSLALQVLTGGAANSWSLQNLGPRIAAGDHAPGFMVKLLLKDLKLVREAAADGELPLPFTALAEQMFTSASRLGCGELGTQSVVRAFEQLADCRISE